MLKPHDMHEIMKKAKPQNPSCILTSTHRKDRMTTIGHTIIQHTKALAVQPLPCISRYESNPPAR